MVDKLIKTTYTKTTKKALKSIVFVLFDFNFN